MQIRTLYFLLLLSTGTGALAQVDYRQEAPFFNQQVSIYEEWMERQALASFFAFDEPAIDLDSNRVTLRLKFQIDGIDASINAMKQLNKAYQEQSGFSLEEAFFQKAVHLFELPPAHLRIKVESIPADGDPPGVASILSYRKNFITGHLEVSSFSFLRSEVKDSVIIQDFELPGHFLLPVEASVETQRYRQKEREICNYLLEKIKAYFGTRGEFYGAFPNASNTVIFNIKNLKHEVVEEGLLSIFDPYEKLTFTLKVVPHERKGLKLLTVIDGKYGPGLYKPRSRDYHEMDPKYLEALRAYTRKFTNLHLRSWLIEKP